MLDYIERMPFIFLKDSILLARLASDFSQDRLQESCSLSRASIMASCFYVEAALNCLQECKNEKIIKSMRQAESSEATKQNDHSATKKRLPERMKILQSILGSENMENIKSIEEVNKLMVFRNKLAHSKPKKITSREINGGIHIPRENDKIGLPNSNDQIHYGDAIRVIKIVNRFFECIFDKLNEINDNNLHPQMVSHLFCSHEKNLEPSDNGFVRFTIDKSLATWLKNNCIEIKYMDILLIT